MKILLSLFGAITLLGTSTTSLVACDKNKTHEYKPEELSKLKAENKINTANQEIKDNLEWITPQEKPFNEVDNKWYYVVWKGNNQLNINKFNNDKFPNEIMPFNEKDRIIVNYKAFTIGQRPKDLYIIDKNGMTIKNWSEDNRDYIKLVYRWNLDTQEPDLVLDNDGNIKVKGE